MKKRVTFNIPDRGPGEEPATEKQIQYILRLADQISEVEVRHLGKWQASELIDQLKEARDAQEGKRSKSGGCLGCAGLVAIALIAVWLVGGNTGSEDDDEKGDNSPEWRAAAESAAPAKEPGGAESPATKQEAEEPSAEDSPKNDTQGTPQPKTLTNFRTWTEKNGRTLEARLLKLTLIDGQYVGEFEKKDGESFQYKIGNLSEKDIELAKWLVETE